MTDVLSINTSLTPEKIKENNRAYLGAKRKIEGDRTQSYFSLIPPSTKGRTQGTGEPSEAGGFLHSQKDLKQADLI